MEVSQPFGTSKSVPMAEITVKFPNQREPSMIRGVLDLDGDLNILSCREINWVAGAPGTARIEGSSVSVFTNDRKSPCCSLPIFIHQFPSQFSVSPLIRDASKIFHIQPSRQSWSNGEFILLLHHFLAHPGITRTWATLKASGLDITRDQVTESIAGCQICQSKNSTKSSVLTRRPHFPSNSPAATSPPIENHQLHADTLHLPKTPNDEKYIPLIVDANTRYIWVRTLVTLSDTRKHLVEVVNHLQAASRLPILSLHTDCGTEYIVDLFTF